MSAEFATVLPAVVLLLAVVLTTGSAARMQLQCLDAASAAARLAARGESDAHAVAAARRAGPPGAVVSLSAGGEEVTVTVRAPLRLLLLRSPSLTVEASATTPREPVA